MSGMGSGHSGGWGEDFLKFQQRAQQQAAMIQHATQPTASATSAVAQRGVGGGWSDDFAAFRAQQMQAQPQPHPTAMMPMAMQQGGMAGYGMQMPYSGAGGMMGGMPMNYGAQQQHQQHPRQQSAGEGQQHDAYAAAFDAAQAHLEDIRLSTDHPSNADQRTAAEAAAQAEAAKSQVEDLPADAHLHMSVDERAAAATHAHLQRAGIAPQFNTAADHFAGLHGGDIELLDPIRPAPLDVPLDARASDADAAQDNERMQGSDALSHTAGSLIASLGDESARNDKFAQSSFMALMRRLRDKEVLLRDQDLIEAQTAQPLGSAHVRIDGVAVEAPDSLGSNFGGVGVGVGSGDGDGNGASRAGRDDADLHR